MQKQPIREKIRETARPRRYGNKARHTAGSRRKLLSLPKIFSMPMRTSYTHSRNEKPFRKCKFTFLNMTVQGRWSLSLWWSFHIDAPTETNRKEVPHMILLYIVMIFLVVYFDQHGPYLNILDVALMSTAAFFILFAIVILIAAWKNN